MNKIELKQLQSVPSKDYNIKIDNVDTDINSHSHISKIDDIINLNERSLNQKE